MLAAAIGKLKRLVSRQLQGEAGGVFRGMLTLVMGAGMARVVGIASIPILTRVYSPDDYGVLAVYTSLVAVLVPALTLCYVTAIPLPKTDAMAFNLFVLCAKLIAAGTLLIALALGLFGKTVLGWFSMEEFAHWWWLIALGACGTATYELFSLWATRKKDYKVIAKTQFTQAATGNATKIILGLLSIKPLGLVVGQIIAQSGGIGSYFKSAISDFNASKAKLSNRKQKMLALHYQEFPWFRLPSQFLMVFSVQAPIMMMAALYGKELTGQLGLAMMALSLPVGLIGQAISKAYYAEIASIGHADVFRILRITKIVQKQLFSIGVPFTLILLIFSESLFQLIFGPKWRIAGIYASTLAPFILFQFTSSPLMEVINIIGSQRIFLALNFFRIVGLLIIFFLARDFSLTSSIFIKTISFYLSAFYLAASALVFLMLNKEVRKRANIC